MPAELKDVRQLNIPDNGSFTNPHVIFANDEQKIIVVEPNSRYFYFDLN